MKSDKTGKGPTITYGTTAARSVISEFGWDVNAERWIVDSDGNKVMDIEGNPIKINEFGGVVPQDGGPTPKKKSFNQTHEISSDKNKV